MCYQKIFIFVLGYNNRQSKTHEGNEELLEEAIQQKVDSGMSEDVISGQTGVSNLSDNKAAVNAPVETTDEANLITPAFPVNPVAVPNSDTQNGKPAIGNSAQNNAGKTGDDENGNSNAESNNEKESTGPAVQPSNPNNSSQKTGNENIETVSNNSKPGLESADKPAIVTMGISKANVTYGPGTQP